MAYGCNEPHTEQLQRRGFGVAGRDLGGRDLTWKFREESGPADPHPRLSRTSLGTPSPASGCSLVHAQRAARGRWGVMAVCWMHQSLGEAL